MNRKFMAALLAMVMVIGMLPTSAMAHNVSEQSEEPPHVHNYCNQTTLSEGTCTTPAQFWVYCDCGDGFEVEGAVNSEAHYAGCPHEKEHVHKYEKTVLSEGTCITKSEYWFACECGDAYKEEGELNANGHLYSNGVCLLCNAAAPADPQEPVEEIAYATASTAGLDNVPKTGSAFVEWLYALIFG